MKRLQIATTLLGLLISFGAYAQLEESPASGSAPAEESPASANPSAGTSASGATSIGDSESVNIEDLYKAAPVPEAAPPPASESQEELTEAEKLEIQKIQRSADFKNSQMRKISDLNELVAFSDISVIQRRYLPKTERFQIYTGLGLSTNSPWFLNAGGKINFSYNFSENWGVEFSGLFLTSSEKEAARDIRNNNSLEPERFILTKSHIGVDLVWSPIYGKITNLDNEITPYDMYFSLGGGISGTRSQEKNVATLHLAVGQIFAISKSWAFRWDYSWYAYQATPQQDSLTASPPSKNLYNDLVFTAGISFFFPEAEYR